MVVLAHCSEERYEAQVPPSANLRRLSPYIPMGFEWHCSNGKKVYKFSGDELQRPPVVTLRRKHFIMAANPGFEAGGRCVYNPNGNLRMGVIKINLHICKALIRLHYTIFFH